MIKPDVFVHIILLPKECMVDEDGTFNELAGPELQKLSVMTEGNDKGIKTWKKGRTRGFYRLLKRNNFLIIMLIKIEKCFENEFVSCLMMDESDVCFTQ